MLDEDGLPKSSQALPEANPWPDINKVGLLTHQTHHRGPARRFWNLKKGLEAYGVEVVQKPSLRGEYPSACLQTIVGMESLNPKTTMFGPNVASYPTEFPSSFLSSGQHHFILQSKWVVDMFSNFIDEDKLYICPVGVDHNAWFPADSSACITTDCFIYFKNRPRQDLDNVRRILKDLKLSYKVIDYGSYHENELLNTCRSCRFAILLTNTETQGNTTLQILSANVPTYVFNAYIWRYERNNAITCPATSVAMFEVGVTGDVSPDSSIDIDHFKQFLSKVDTYEPRKWIEENLTIKHGAYYLLRAINRFQEQQAQK